MNKTDSFKKLKISFCTTCMGRLHHVKETMPKNIENMLPYGNIEFLLLNYNSNDNLDEWVEREMKDYIKNGTLTYLKTFEPKYWNAAHAKNIVTRNATGDIVCNVDSDSFLEKGFAEYVNECFKSNQDIFLTGRVDNAPADAVGRICALKPDFMKIGGYDEKILGYGYEDTDLYSRLIQAGVKEKGISLKYIRSIEHGHHDRLKNTRLIDHVEEIWVYESKTGFKTFILKKDKTFEHHVLTRDKNAQLENGGFAIDEDQTQSGRWETKENELIFRINLPKLVTIEAKLRGNTCTIDNSTYIKVQGSNKMFVFYGYAMSTNQIKYINNKKEPLKKINLEGFGKARTYKNFDYETVF